MAVAASTSMPDSPLYPVKLATEQIQMTITTSDEGKARLCVTLADKRVAEICYLAGKGDAQRIEDVTQQLDDHLVMLADSVSVQSAQEEAPRMLAPAAAPEAAAPPAEGAPGEADVYVEPGDQTELEKTVGYYAAKHPNALRTELNKAPQSAKPALRHAISVSEAGYEKALAALD